MDGNIASGLGTALIALIIIGLIIGAVPAYFVGRSGHNTITSPVRIEPEYKLVIKNNKVDTLFVYRRP